MADDHDSYWLYRISPCPHILGYTLVHPHWSDAPRVCYDHYLTFVDKGGNLRIELEDEEHDIPEFHYFILPPGLRHRREATASHAFRRFWLHFDWTFSGRPWIKPILTSGPTDRDKIRHAPEFVPSSILKGAIANPTEFIAKFERANDLFHAPPGFQALAARGIVLDLLLDLLAPPVDKAADTELGAALQIRRELDRFGNMAVDRAGRIVDFLAARGQSYDHQARVFKRVFGTTPPVCGSNARKTACGIHRQASPRSQKDWALRMWAISPSSSANTWGRVRVNTGELWRMGELIARGYRARP